MKFLEKLREAVDAAMKQEPTAWLYEVQAVMKKSETGVEPDRLDHITVVFGLPTGKTLFYEADENGPWRDKIENASWFGDRPLPNRISADLPEVYDRIMQANLITGTLTGRVTLRHTLHYRYIEPFFAFETRLDGHIRYIIVYYYSGKVELTELLDNAGLEQAK